MKNILKIVSIIGLMTIAQTAYTSEITDTYNTGDTLTATTLETIKNAVNDNDTRISEIVLTPGPTGPAGADSTVAGPTGPAGAAGTNGTNGVDATGPFINTRAPTVTDDINDANAYSVGSIWVDTIANATYTLTDNAAGSAVWKLITYAPTVYAIGDTGPAGGWVFYVDADGRHGLEAAPTDQSAGIQWNNGSFTDTEANGDGLGAGEMNTMLIIANQGSDSTTYAAGISASLVIAGTGAVYGDWYLPSKFELNLMYLNIGQGSTNVGGFASDGYWSSSEFASSGALGENFFNGSQFSFNKTFPLRVRAVRAF